MRISEAFSHLPPAVAGQALHDLLALLPPAVPDTADERCNRDAAAVEAVGSLNPANAIEARLATQIVGADAHAADCLRLAVRPGIDADEVRRCRAQAAMMMRQAQSGVRTLLRMQAVREKAEAAMQPAAMERAGYWFRDVSVPEAEAAPEPVADVAVEAEQYARIYPARARRIRALGGLPERLDFGPPSAELVRAIVMGSSPALRALDAVG